MNEEFDAIDEINKSGVFDPYNNYDDAASLKEVERMQRAAQFKAVQDANIAKQRAMEEGIEKAMKEAGLEKADLDKIMSPEDFPLIEKELKHSSYKYMKKLIAKKQRQKGASPKAQPSPNFRRGMSPYSQKPVDKQALIDKARQAREQGKELSENEFIDILDAIIG